MLEGMLGPPVTQHIVDHMTASPHSGKPEAPGRERKGGGGGGGGLGASARCQCEAASLRIFCLFASLPMILQSSKPRSARQYDIVGEKLSLLVCSQGSPDQLHMG